MAEGWTQKPSLGRLGTCYQAANWIKVGQTTGRGKKCPTSKPILPIKDIWLHPLHRNFRSILCR
nr:Druantia anti-phage system protein DruA [Accumulibacter sp.]